MTPNDATAAGETRRLFVMNLGFLTRPRIARILTLVGHRPVLGLPPPGEPVGIWGASPTAWRGQAVARRRGCPIVTVEDAFLRSVLPGRASGRLAARGPIGLLIDLCRGISTGDRYVRSGEWAKSATPLVPLPLARQFSGLRIGIVGMGRVGRAVAARAAAFGCPISYTDLQPMSDVPHTFVADLLSLANGSDALILAAAADKGEAIVNAEVLHALGRDSYLINIARGKLVDEPALVAALQSGQIAGAGLDVFADEPRVPGELFELEQVVLQPHRASATVQTRTRMGQMVVASLVDVFAGRKPNGSVTG